MLLLRSHCSFMMMVVVTLMMLPRVVHLKEDYWQWLAFLIYGGQAMELVYSKLMFYLCHCSVKVGEEVFTYTIITVEAKPTFSEIHHRMPVSFIKDHIMILSFHSLGCTRWWWRYQTMAGFWACSYGEGIGGAANTVPINLMHHRL